jgi:hypothetical protein
MVRFVQLSLRSNIVCLNYVVVAIQKLRLAAIIDASHWRHTGKSYLFLHKIYMVSVVSIPIQAQIIVCRRDKNRCPTSPLSWNKIQYEHDE